jgi:hypothetical protein
LARPAKVPAALLVEDIGLWPRRTIDSSHVSGMVEALLAGVSLPPVIADRESKRLTDGFHRTRAAIRAYGPQAEVEVFWRDYPNEAAMFEEAVALNAAHGRRLTPYDHARIMARAKELGIDTEKIAKTLHVRKVTLQRKAKYGRIKINGDTEEVALKRGLRHLDGEILTEEQQAYNERSSGWPPAFHAHQLVMALEAGVPEVSENFGAALLHLRELIDGLALD